MATKTWESVVCRRAMHDEMSRGGTCFLIGEQKFGETMVCESSFTQLQVQAFSRRGMPRARAEPQYLVRPVQESF